MIRSHTLRASYLRISLLRTAPLNITICRSYHNDNGNNSNRDSNRGSNRGNKSFVLVSSLVAAAAVASDPEELVGVPIEGLPTYQAADVRKRDGSREEGDEESYKVWITFKQGVYDVTSFIAEHPGGDKLLIGAGGPIEPFWSLYAVHKKPYVYKLLEMYRIGNLEPTDVVIDTSDPYSGEPTRHPAFTINNEKPFNAETPLTILADNIITPNDLFYIRHHHPVPDVSEEDYLLTIEGEGIEPLTLTLEQLRANYEQVSVTSVLQCAGNRRCDMANHKPVRGMNWGGGAIGNAVWSGPMLRDVLVKAGYDEESGEACHVVADGLDYGPDGTAYGASILIEKAMDPRGDVILALEMNGETLPRDHGYPVRLIVPGVVGARNVKWVGSLTLSKEESYSHWQRRDYKGFNPSTDWHNVDFDDRYAKSIQNQPVQSMITEPLNNDTVEVVDGKIKLRGYAYSGAGAKVIRVDVTLDKGETWHTAELEQDNSSLNRSWSWSLWEINVPVPENCQDTVSALCCAVDANYNRQPENIKNIWNLRGALSNAWHTINLNLKR